jgi:hypothetical protein
MAIKIKVTKENIIEKMQYPMLMVSKKTGAIILMISEEKGFTIAPKGADNSYDYSMTWDMNYFNVFHGNVTLTQ